MMHILILSSQVNARTILAAESLRRAIVAAGHQASINETKPSDLIFSIDNMSSSPEQVGHTRVVAVTTQQAIREPAALVAQHVETQPSIAKQIPSSTGFIVGITSCPTGIAHTFMAAEGLEAGADALGYGHKIETQGSVGAENPLSTDEIARADVVIIAADTNVDLSRFAGKRVYKTGTKPAIRDGVAVIQTALAEATVHKSEVSQRRSEEKAGGNSFYKHLMTGVSHMLPLVVAGGLLIALAFAFGGIEAKGPLAEALMTIGGGKGAFGLFVPILAGYIAYSVADRPGLAPGLVGGMMASHTGSGFLGGMAAGFLAGYFVKWLNETLKLPRTLEGLKPTLLLPLLGSLVTGLMMIFVIGKPVSAALEATTNWLTSLGNSSAGLLGALLGGMMAFDMGGPINKAAYTFGTGLLTNQVYAPIAAVMAAGMTPPLALFVATMLFRNRFTPDERDAGKAAGVLGLSFITEGAIPFAARDPLHVIPALVVGSATAGAISMAAGCLLRAPHGGVFVLLIPGAVTNLPMYIVAITSGTVVSAALLGVLKKPLPESDI